MSSDNFIWLPEIIEKLLEKHDVQSDEVEEVFELGPRYFRGPKGKRRGEDVYYVFGQTVSGRYLIIVYIKKKDGRALILSAREMTTAERQRYQRK
jgi:hypothetical protein